MADTNRVGKNEADFYLKLGNIRLDATSLAVITSIVVVLFTILLFFIAHRRKSVRRSVILLGLCESGKTLLYSRLVHKRFVQTQTSIKENVGVYYPAAKSHLKIIDIPGHERLRMKFFDDFKSSARAIIFVIDSLSFQKELKDIAQLMYTVLGDQTVVRNCPRILVICNKQDQTMAKSYAVIKSQLEKEMNAVRITEAASLNSTDAIGNNNTFLGKRGKDFEFSQLQPLQIDFVDCSVRGDLETNEVELSGVENWLSKIA